MRLRAYIFPLSQQKYNVVHAANGSDISEEYRESEGEWRKHDAAVK